MRLPSPLIVPNVTLCLTAFLAALWAASADAQVRRGPVQYESVTTVTSADAGFIEGTVKDEAGKPLDGVVISALGGTTAFAVSDKTGKYTLKQLPPGPYVVRAHLAGFLAARSTMVNVRPAGKSASSFTLRREGAPDAPRISEASVAAVGDAPATAAGKAAGRDESELGWRLRHLKRGILRDGDMRLAGVAEDDDWFITDSFEFLGKAVGSSAKAASAMFTDLSLGGQVNLLTTGAFDNPLQLLQLDRTSSVAFFSLGAPVGSHGDWNVRAAMNQSDLSSWMLAARYAVTAPVPHRYRFGMSYSLQRYEGGNTAALTLPDTARNVGSVFAFDDWQITPVLSLEYGASYAHYDYLKGQPLFSPRVAVAYSPARLWRVRVSAAREVSVPGAEEFLPPTSAEYLPPQRTFSPLSAAGLQAQAMRHYEVGVERLFNGAALAVRTYGQHIDRQTVTIFGLRRDTPSSLGHYYVGAAGDANVRGVGVTLTHSLTQHLRGSVDYSFSSAEWVDPLAGADVVVLQNWVPSAVRQQDRIHDITTSLETEIPFSATRVLVLYKLNDGFASNERYGDPGFGARFDVRVTQALPFMNFSASQWEMLVGVRNIFHESLAGTSIYDELLVVRPPKRLVGGLTVKF
jgi:hypothetical protein